MQDRELLLTRHAGIDGARVKETTLARLWYLVNELVSESVLFGLVEFHRRLQFAFCRRSEACPHFRKPFRR